MTIAIVRRRVLRGVLARTLPAPTLARIFFATEFTRQRDAIRIYPLSSVADLSRIRVSEEARSGQLLHQHAAAIEYQETELAALTRWNGRITNASKR